MNIAERISLAGIIACLALLYYETAEAKACDEVHYSVSVGSKHISDGSTYPKFNERNLGFGVECDGVQVGLYHNSLDKPSAYIGGTIPGSEYFGVKYGLVTGYNYIIAPYAAGYVRIYNLEFTVLPRTPVSPLIIAYSVRW